VDIKLHPKAEEDFQEALNHYFKINLEKKFIHYLDLTFKKILDFPNLYQYETKTSQKVLMDKFPYIVIYGQYRDICRRCNGLYQNFIKYRYSLSKSI
jgi:hypothetical protein